MRALQSGTTDCIILWHGPIKAESFFLVKASGRCLQFQNFAFCIFMIIILSYKSCPIYVSYACLSEIAYLIYNIFYIHMLIYHIYNIIQYDLTFSSFTICNACKRTYIIHFNNIYFIYKVNRSILGIGGYRFSSCLRNCENTGYVRYWVIDEGGQ